MLVCEHCGIQRLPSTKHVRRCELDQEKKARELAERSRANAARSGPLLRPPPRKLQRRSSVGVDRPHEATGLYLDVSEGDDDIGGGGAVDGNSGDKAVADEHAPADPPLAEDAVEGDAVSVPSPTFAQVRCVPVMARPAFLRPVLPPGSERQLPVVTSPRDLSDYGARVDLAFASCREWFSDPSHIGWASCKHADRPARRSRDSTVVSDGEVEALRNSIVHQLSAEEVKVWTKRWNGGAVDLAKTQV